MQVIFKAKQIVLNILGNQMFDLKKQYRPFLYVKQFKINGKCLLFNLLTFEILLLNEAEINCYTENPDLLNETVSLLVNKWFLVPTEFNDLNLVKQVETVRTSINKIYAPQKFNSFTILPTTGCNARCFYCFELGSIRRDMSKQTAADVADFIIKNKTDGKINLRWFGGEPLCNMKAIDIICNKLKKANIDFSSYMITNGYLFDDEVIYKAINNWNINKVQITLDGTEKVYNRTKNYIYKDSQSPFKKVLYNIEQLLKLKLQVRIRLNLDEHNANDLYTLIDDLAKRYSNYKNINIRTNLLFDESCARIKKKQSQELKHHLVKTQADLQKYAREKGMLDLSTRVHSGHTGHCMADSNYSTTILPDGELGKCQSYLDDHFWGNIYSDKINFEELNWFKTVKTISPACDGCKFRPACVFPQCCITIPKKCDEFDKVRIETNIDLYLKNIYENFKGNI